MRTPIPQPPDKVRRSVLTISVLFVSILVLPAGASAQQRGGFWITGGISIGSIGASAEGLQTDRGGGLDFDLAAGWTLTPQLLVGADLGGYGVTFNEPQPLEATDVDIVIVLAYYPRLSSGFFVKGGAGPSFLDNLKDQAPVIRGRGFVVMGGVGYDLYLGRNFSLISSLEFSSGHIGDVEFDSNRQFTNWKHNIVAATVGIKFN